MGNQSWLKLGELKIYKMIKKYNIIYTSRLLIRLEDEMILLEREQKWRIILFLALPALILFSSMKGLKFSWRRIRLEIE